jgi:hypothetical protein
VDAFNQANGIDTNGQEVEASSNPVMRYASSSPGRNGVAGNSAGK